jgi:hypothetical protein
LVAGQLHRGLAERANENVEEFLRDSHSISSEACTVAKPDTKGKSTPPLLSANLKPFLQGG